MSKILVTGAAGFIGFHTAARLLRDGHEVVGVDSLNNYYDPTLKQARLRQLENFPNFVFVKEDVANKDGMENLWREHGPFLEVVHLAAQAGVRHSINSPYEYVTSNCMGHLTILEMCRHTQGFKHLVYASTSSVYGTNEKRPYSVQDRADHPVSLYAATKRAGELMSHSYAHLFNIPQTGLRFFTVYGPWGRPDMALFIFVDALLNNKKLPVFNRGEMRRDFTYIDDVVEGIISALNAPPQGDAPARVLNIGNNRSEKLMDFIRIIERETGQSADIEFMEMQAGDVRETYADITETTAVTGYAPSTSIDEGIGHFVAWYKDYYGAGA